ncbi:MAG: tripartite tricarboxylate transporter permease [Symploca sp. SIO2C1]|nr:tripartite tricarboxylate transporter permease [Symploca sp. SIO2C1]
MDILDFLLQGFVVALKPLNLGLALVGAFIGTLVGAMPGIGPINGVAVLLPLSYSLGLPPETALIMLAGIYYGAEYGGRISSILLNIPGDAGAVMSTLDGYPLAHQGKAGSALALSAISSFIGGTIAVIGLTLFAPPLAQLAIKFGPAEYFSLMIFAFASLAVIVGKNPLKTGISAVLGVMLAIVGVDSGTGVLRYTYGEPELYDGIDFLIVIIGLFAISEILLLVERTEINTVQLGTVIGLDKLGELGEQRELGELGELGRGGRADSTDESSIGTEMVNLVPIAVNQAIVNFKEVLACKWTILRSSIIGFIIGVLPGTGASIASAVAYATEKRFNDQEKTFGKGDIRGLAAPEAANNAAAVGAFIPMLTLGIPGSGTTAILLGGLLLYNIQPGPMLFTQQPEIVGGLIASMYLGNLMLLVLNLPLVGWFTRILLVPNWLLVPGIVVMAFVGVFSVHGSIVSIFFMLAIGIFGYFLRKLQYSLIALILGFVLGEVMEGNLRRALAISGGDIGILFQSQISQSLWILTLSIVILLPIVRFVGYQLKVRQESR